MDTKNCMFAITADYRPNNENKPVYYVLAINRREAKMKFQKVLGWLTIYDCYRIRQEDKIAEIIENPNKYIYL